MHTTNRYSECLAPPAPGRKSPPVQVCRVAALSDCADALRGPDPVWPKDAGPIAASPRPRRIIANNWIRTHAPRRIAGILHAELRHAAEAIAAEGGRGSEAAVLLAEALRARVNAGPVDLSGPAPLLSLELGLSISERAAREGVKRLAEHTRLVTAGSRHAPARIRLRTAWLRGLFELEADPLRWTSRAAYHDAVSLWCASAETCRSSRDSTAPAYIERARGDSSEYPDPDLDHGAEPRWIPDDRDLLGIPRIPGPAPTPWMVDSLRRRGVLADLTAPEAAHAHLILRERALSPIARMTLVEMRRYATPQTCRLLGQLEAADVGRLERRLSFAGTEAASPEAGPVIDGFVFERLGLRAASLNISVGRAWCHLPAESAEDLADPRSLLGRMQRAVCLRRVNIPADPASDASTVPSEMHSDANALTGVDGWIGVKSARADGVSVVRSSRVGGRYRPGGSGVEGECLDGPIGVGGQDGRQGTASVASESRALAAHVRPHGVDGQHDEPAQPHGVEGSTEFGFGCAGVEGTGQLGTGSLMDASGPARASSPACPAKSSAASSPSSRACPMPSKRPAALPASPGPSSPRARDGPASTSSGRSKAVSSPLPSSSTCSAASASPCPSPRPHP